VTGPGWVYVLTHPAWDKLGMVKVGRTGRDPRTRAAEICSVSGLLAPATVAWCSPVSDMAAAEQAVHRMLGSHRVRKRRELFRVDVARAREVIEAVAGSVPVSALPLASLGRSLPARPAAAGRYRPRPSWPGFRRYGRRRVPVPIRVAAGIAAIICWFTLVQPQLGNGWLF
jgi:hypothetical protein